MFYDRIILDQLPRLSVRCRTLVSSFAAASLSAAGRLPWHRSHCLRGRPAHDWRGYCQVEADDRWRSDAQHGGFTTGSGPVSWGSVPASWRESRRVATYPLATTTHSFRYPCSRAAHRGARQDAASRRGGTAGFSVTYDLAGPPFAGPFRARATHAAGTQFRRRQLWPTGAAGGPTFSRAVELGECARRLRCAIRALRSRARPEPGAIGGHAGGRVAEGRRPYLMGGAKRTPSPVFWKRITAREHR